MTERFIWEAGHPRRKMHLASFDRLGNFADALCGIGHDFNRSCNLPLGRPRCKNCLAVEERLSALFRTHGASR
jgi:hypothetical protein